MTYMLGDTCHLCLSWEFASYIIFARCCSSLFLQAIVENLCRVTNRAPMQWSDRHFAGFTTGNSTWIKVNEDYHSVNVEVGCY